MGKPKTSGLNDRFADDRFSGYSGESGENEYPQHNSVSVTVTVPAGVTDSTVTLPAGARRELTVVQVNAAFDGAATILVGSPAVANADVQAGEISILTTGNKQQRREYTQPAAAKVRVTIGGAPTVGSAVVTVFYTV